MEIITKIKVREKKTGGREEGWKVWYEKKKNKEERINGEKRRKRRKRNSRWCGLARPMPYTPPGCRCLNYFLQVILLVARCLLPARWCPALPSPALSYVPLLCVTPFPYSVLFLFLALNYTFPLLCFTPFPCFAFLLFLALLYSSPFLNSLLLFNFYFLLFLLSIY